MAPVLAQFQQLNPQERQTAIKKMHSDPAEPLNQYLDSDELTMDATVNLLTARH